MENMVAKAMQRWGRVDILVANADVLRDRIEQAHKIMVELAA